MQKLEIVPVERNLIGSGTNEKLMEYIVSARDQKANEAIENKKANQLRQHTENIASYRHAFMNMALKYFAIDEKMFLEMPKEVREALFEKTGILAKKRFITINTLMGLLEILCFYFIMDG